MISYLKGTLSRKSPTEIVVDVGGVGYAANIPISTYEQLPEVGSTVEILTHLHVREDALQLFGFATESERTLFRLLISVSGIGPRTAQGILSGAQAKELRGFIAEGNSGALTSFPGIGRKSAERIIVELRDRVSKLEVGEGKESGNAGGSTIRAEALMALVSLGFTRQSAEKAIRSALTELGTKQVTIEELLKVALQSAPR